MNRAPVAVVRLNHDVPPKLEDIINRALEKDRELRYQHASEMRSELLRLKRDSESGYRSAAGSSAVAVAESSCGSGCEALEDCGPSFADCLARIWADFTTARIETSR